MTTRELRNRLSHLRSTLRRLHHTLELAASEADDLASRGALSRSGVADPRRSVREAMDGPE